MNTTSNLNIEQDDLIKNQPEEPDRRKNEEDFLYGAISGPQQEEFHVIKFNKKGKPSDRVLVIDGFNIFTRHLNKDADEGKAGADASGRTGGLVRSGSGRI